MEITNITENRYGRASKSGKSFSSLGAALPSNRESSIRRGAADSVDLLCGQYLCFSSVLMNPESARRSAFKSVKHHLARTQEKRHITVGIWDLFGNIAAVRGSDPEAAAAARVGCRKDYMLTIF